MTATLLEKTKSYTAEDLLGIDVQREIDRIAVAVRQQTLGRLKRKGLVLGLSGGIDSSVCAGLAAAALGPERVLGVLMPENDSDPESERLGRLVASAFGIEVIKEDIGPALAAAGCYRRRDEAVASVIPGFKPTDKFKIVLSQLDAQNPFRVFYVVAQLEDGGQIRERLPIGAYQTIVAATNFKQRVRKMMEYYHGDRMRYGVIGTPNRLEFDQGFFVKGGDGLADVKPIAHLYKSQVYQLAEALGVPEEVRRRPPTTDTYSLAQSQEEFFFSVPYTVLDLCMAAKNRGIEPAAIVDAAGLSVDQVERIYRDIDAKRSATAYLHEKAALVDAVGEIGYRG